MLDKGGMVMNKGDRLITLSQHYNVSKFIIVDKELKVTYQGFNLDQDYRSNLHLAVAELLKASNLCKVNIRSFKNDSDKGSRFVMGLDMTGSIIKVLEENAAEGLTSIVNEWIDPSDTGVSGVILGGSIISFSPDNTSRCVESGGCCTLPADVGCNLLKKVYDVDLTYLKAISKSSRIEFSVHPNKVGTHEERTVIWDIEDIDPSLSLPEPRIYYPNNFSKLIGNKIFGLCIADIMFSGQLNIPIGEVHNRRLVGTFTVGKLPKDLKKYKRIKFRLRTAPAIKEPGKFPDLGDLGELLNIFKFNKEEFRNISSGLRQIEIPARYAGSALISEKGILLEGVSCSGEDFMLGRVAPVELPRNIKLLLERKFNIILRSIQLFSGNIKIEWVIDPEGNVWVVQFDLEKANDLPCKDIIYKGKASNVIDFECSRGLEELREIVNNIEEGEGIRLLGNVGVLSHFGDILREKKIPSSIERGA